MASTPNVIQGAARVFTNNALGGPTIENESQVVVGATLVFVVNNNADRVGLTFVNMGANDAFVELTTGGAGTPGIKLAANGGAVNFNVRDDFTLPARSWYGYSTVGSTLYVLEIIRQIRTPDNELKS